MIKCINCGIPMVGVMSFSKDKQERFCRCPKCYSESKHRRVNDDDLDFGEYLQKWNLKNGYSINFRTVLWKWNAKIKTDMQSND